MTTATRSRWPGACALTLAVLSACGAPPLPDPTPPETVVEPAAPWQEVSERAGLIVANMSGTADKPFIVESMGAGACWFDFDRDGWLDLYIVYSSTYLDRRSSPPQHDRLYRNSGDGTFEDVTAVAGIESPGWGGGCAIGDVDGDGWSDVYVTNNGPNVLWRNRGDGTFADWTGRAGLDDPKWGASSAFADFDQDGDVDLYVTNYVDFDWAAPMVDGGVNFCTWHGVEVFCGPRGLRFSSPSYYVNRGDGTFEEQTDASGLLGAEKVFGLGVVTLDYDRDGWLDIYSANDGRRNHLWHNRGDGTFEEAGLGAGVGLSDRGKEQAGMGVDAGDFDNDGYPDLFVTNFSQDTYALYHNQGGLFNDVSFDMGITEATKVDGIKMLPPITWRQRPNLLENRGHRFVDVAAASGPFAEPLTGRGSAVADYDNDGDMDIVIITTDDTPRLLRNAATEGRSWLMLSLEATTTARDAIGTVVTVRADGLPTQRIESSPSGSYLSSSDPRVHFGLGSAEHVEIDVEWPGGRKQTFADVAVDRHLSLVEGAAELGAWVP